LDTVPIKARLDAAGDAHRRLEHPFYVAWARGELTREDLSFYAGQYWWLVDGFPDYLETLGRRIDHEGAKKVLAENLADEVEGDHRGLWLAFAESVGADGDVARGEREPETDRCLDAFRAATRTSSTAFALGMLYGYESQTPDVSTTKLAGLRDHYGIVDAGAEYFRVHGELDVEHADDLARAIADVAKGQSDIAEAEAGARRGAAAVCELLDGVARVRAIV
jgi:pyrroloquinoline-quinone synthase